MKIKQKKQGVNKTNQPPMYQQVTRKIIYLNAFYTVKKHNTTLC